TPAAAATLRASGVDLTRPEGGAATGGAAWGGWLFPAAAWEALAAAGALAAAWGAGAAPTEKDSATAFGASPFLASTSTTWPRPTSWPGAAASRATVPSS